MISIKRFRCLHVAQELPDRIHLDAVFIENAERQQRIAGLLHASDPVDLQRRDVPERRTVICHLYLRRPSLVDVLDNIVLELMERAWVAEHHRGPALLHRVDSRIGLVEQDFAALAAWPRLLPAGLVSAAG